MEEINCPKKQEILVSSDLNVRRKSKENRQGKELTSTNVHSSSEISNPSGKSKGLASRLVTNFDGSSIRTSPEKRKKRNVHTKKHRLNLLGSRHLLI